jgi:ubiquitin C-terminal hydrolase
VVSLKRFNSNGSKNNGMVRVPPYLDISGHSITPGQHEYEIYGMVVHGGTSRGGHYVAYTRRGQLWYYFSDSQVRETDWNKVKNAQPYIMFYKRVSQ